MRKPTLKQKLFATHYIKNRGNATQAVLAVYDAKSKKNAYQMAQVLRKNPVVEEEISKQLSRAGMDLTWVNSNMRASIDTNLQEGKPSQAVAMDGLKFLYRLHNVIPGTKNVNLSYSKKVIENSSYEDIKKALDNLNRISGKLLQEIA